MKQFSDILLRYQFSQLNWLDRLQFDLDKNLRVNDRRELKRIKNENFQMRFLRYVSIWQRPK